MDINEYRRRFAASDASPGWDAIDNALASVYGDQIPKHWAPTVHPILGGDDSLDGVSMYRSETEAGEHFHFVTYGFSELYYDEDALGGTASKLGFELTFRLKPFSPDGEAPTWVFSLLNNLARYIFSSGKRFNPFDYLNANGPIRLGTSTPITALAFCIDSQLGTIDTPHGRVQFIQAYGITTHEFETLKESHENAERLFAGAHQGNPLFITDLERSEAPKS